MEMPQTEQQLPQKKPDAPQIPPQDREAMLKVVTAGMKIMYDEKVFPMFSEGLKQDKPMAEKLASQTAGLIKILNDKSKGTLPKQVMLPAGMMLLLEIADFMEQAGMGEASEQDIAEAMKKMSLILMKLYGKGAQQDPSQVQQQDPAQAGAPQQPPQQPTPQAQPQRGLIGA